MKIDIKKIVSADKEIYNILRNLNVNKAEKYKIIGNLVKDLGYIETGEKIANGCILK